MKRLILTSFLLSMGLLVVISTSVAQSEGEVRRAAKELMGNLVTNSDNLVILRRDKYGNTWLRSSGTDDSIIGGEITTFVPSVYEENPFISIDINDDDDDSDDDKHALFLTKKNIPRFFSITHKELNNFTIGKLSEKKLEQILMDRYESMPMTSIEQHMMMEASVTEAGAKTAVKKVVKTVLGVIGGGLVDLLWPSSLGDDDDRPSYEYEDDTYPVREYDR